MSVMDLAVVNKGAEKKIDLMSSTMRDLRDGRRGWTAIDILRACPSVSPSEYVELSDRAAVRVPKEVRTK